MPLPPQKEAFSLLEDNTGLPGVQGDPQKPPQGPPKAPMYFEMQSEAMQWAMLCGLVDWDRPVFRALGGAVGYFRQSLTTEPQDPEAFLSNLPPLRPELSLRHVVESGRSHPTLFLPPYF